jgi:outer membrane receptor protein involved in Fe transport
VRGGSVLIVVDGKPSAILKGNNLAQALQAMPANSVARIEVITSPGPEFPANATAVINLITKKTKTHAPSGSLAINAGDAGRYNGSISGSFGIDKWTFNGALSLRQDRRSQASHVDRISRDDDGAIASHMVEDMKVRSAPQSTSLDLGASYAAGDNDTFSLSGNAATRPRGQKNDDHVVFLDPTSGAVLSDTDTLKSGPVHYNSGSLTSAWKHKGKRDGETFTLQVRHDEGDFLENTRYFETSALPVAPMSGYRQYLTIRQLTDDLSGDYDLPLATDTEFKAGFDIQSTRTTTYSTVGDIDIATGAITPRSTSDSHTLVYQTLSAAYASYQHPLGQWVAQGGLRVENMLTRIREGATSSPTETSDLQWSPGLYLSRELTQKSKLKFTFSHRIDRPNTDQLLAQELVLDAQDVYIGNPYLKPAQTQSFEAGYDYTTKPVTFSGTAYLRQTRDTIVEYAYYRNAGDTLLVNTVENAGNGTVKGLDMSLDLHLWPKADISASSNIFHTELNAPVNGVSVQRSLTTSQNKFKVTYNPTKADSLQLQLIDNGAELNANGWGKSRPFVNLSYSHTLSPKLKLIVTDSNVTNSKGWHQHSETSQYRDDTIYNPHGSTFYIGLDYKLGAATGG